MTEKTSAESKLAEKIWGDRDCSQYSTKTFKGLAEYNRCKKGLKHDEKSFFNLKWIKGDKKEFDPNKPCGEYSTKTFKGLSTEPLRLISKNVLASPDLGSRLA